MHWLLIAFDSPYPALLCLLLGSIYFRQSTRALAAFQASGGLLALLLLLHPPVLLLVRVSMERDVALPFALTLFCLTLLALRSLGSTFRLAGPPPRWRLLTGALLVLDSAIVLGWSGLPLATPLLPGRLTAALVLGVEAGFAGLVLHWFWHAPGPGRLRGLNQQAPPGFAPAQRAYEQQAAHWQPTPPEFRAWLQTLPVPARQVAQRAGAGLMWTTPLFRRYVLEARGHRYVTFMAEHLSEDEFIRWVDSL